MTCTEHVQYLQSLIDQQTEAVARRICEGQDATAEYFRLERLTHRLVQAMTFASRSRQDEARSSQTAPSDADLEPAESATMRLLCTCPTAAGPPIPALRTNTGRPGQSARPSGQ
jgi:hypothetical protein